MVKLLIGQGYAAIMQHSHVMNAINVVKRKVITMYTEEKLQVLSIPGWSGKVN